MQHCYILNTTLNVMPNERNKIVNFENLKHELCVPFVIYADIENTLRVYVDNDPQTTQKCQKYEAFSVAYYLK